MAEVAGVSNLQCSICCDTLKDPVVLIKHRNDNTLDLARKRGHYFHKDCILLWKDQCDKEFLCPLDRDGVGRLQTVPLYSISSLDLALYGYDYAELIRCARSVNQKLLDKIEHIDEVDRNGRTLAYYACRYGNYALVERLLPRGADFNRGTGDHELTPLMTAVLYGHTELVKRLLRDSRVRAGLGALDRQGRTAFSYACQNCRYGMIREFLHRQCVSSAEVNSIMNQFADTIRHDRTYGYEILSLLSYWSVRLGSMTKKTSNTQA